jgi:hypothetical protein
VFSAYYKLGAFSYKKGDGTVSLRLWGKVKKGPGRPVRSFQPTMTKAWPASPTRS